MISDETRWAAYVRDALIETTISKDVLLMNPVQKTALLRRVFDLACRYRGQELSYQKMMGQFCDAGNTTTLAHYLQLLKGAVGAELLARHLSFCGHYLHARPKILSTHSNSGKERSSLEIWFNANTDF